MLKKILVLFAVLSLASCSKVLHNSSENEVSKPVVVKDEKSVAQKDEKKHVVFFDTNKSDLTSEAQASLENKAIPMVKEVLKYSNGKVVIEGYCDERGSVSYNKKLGKKRAEAVKEFLVKNGVKAKKISVKSYGKAMPVDSGHNEEAWAKNRRAVTIAIKM